MVSSFLSALWKSRTVYLARDVFSSTGIPTITFVDRLASLGNNAENAEIKYKLNNRGLVNLYGDSKSGKTVLCMKMVEHRRPILLFGQHIKNENEFWNTLSTHLGIGAKRALKSGRTEEDKISGELKGSVPGVIEGAVKSGSTVTSSDEREIHFTTNSHEIVEALIRAKRPLIIDDFHSVSKRVQEQIVSELKPAIDHGETVA